MPWRRHAGRAYFYRAVRVGSQPRALYVGTGPAAELAAAEIAHRQAERVAHREALAESERAYASAVAPLLQLESECDALLQDSMTAAGYHRYKHSPWRKRKG